MKTALKLLSLISLALLIAGCGDKTEANYITGYNKAVGQMSAAGDAMTATEDMASFVKARKKVDAAIAAFAKLTPPDSVKAEHKALLKSLRAASAEMQKITDSSTEKQDNAAVEAGLKHLEDASKAAGKIESTLGD